MEFYNDGISWRLGNALTSSLLDFFILDKKLNPLCYTRGASFYFPSFLKCFEYTASRLIFPSNAKEGMSFTSYLKQYFGKTDFKLIEKNLSSCNQSSFSIQVPREKKH